MPYVNKFVSADALVAHLQGVVPMILDPLVRIQYTGFLSVSAVSVVELCVKEIFVEFCEKKHKVFGAYCANVLDRMNGRVSLKDLREVHIKRFGQKYLDRFNLYLESEEERLMRAGNGSVKARFGNLVVWRNSFAHEAVLPVNASFTETVHGFEASKVVLDCLSRAMTR